jgi:hypothetical protein
VVLGDPVPVEAQLLGVLGQVDGPLQGLRGAGTTGHRYEVEYRQWHVVQGRHGCAPSTRWIIDEA